MEADLFAGEEKYPDEGLGTTKGIVRSILNEALHLVVCNPEKGKFHCGKIIIFTSDFIGWWLGLGWIMVLQFQIRIRLEITALQTVSCPSSAIFPRIPLNQYQ